MKDALQYAQRGSGSKGNRYPVYRFRLAATERLVNNRYLEDGEAFYKTVETHYENMIMFNEMPGDWRENGVTVDGYIVENTANDNASE